MGARLLRPQEVPAVRGDQERGGAPQPRRAQPPDRRRGAKTVGVVRSHRIRRIGLKLASPDQYQGGAGCVQPTLLAVKAASLQRRYRNASQEHI